MLAVECVTEGWLERFDIIIDFETVTCFNTIKLNGKNLEPQGEKNHTWLIQGCVCNIVTDYEKSATVWERDA